MRQDASELGTSGTPLARLGEVTCFVFAAASVLATAGILVVFATEAVRFFADVPAVDFLADTQWAPRDADPRVGVWPLVTGTLLTTVIAIAVALPLGVLSAIYLSEFAPSGVRRALKPALEVLAGIPTIVFGFFALVVVTPFLQDVVPGLADFNALSPGLIVGIMILPMVSSLSEDALHAVPESLREAAIGLGATRLSTIFRVVLPSAASGLAAAVFLAVSRAVGETVIVTIAAGQVPRMTLDPRIPIQTMTAWIVEVGHAAPTSQTLAYRALFAVGAALLVVTFALNLVSKRLARRYRRAWQ